MAKCDVITSVTAGTVMQGTRQPLRSWLLAAYLLTTDKRGVSALHLQRQLGLKRYETAFQMLHELRAAMVAPDRTQLNGRVEVDETFVGAPPRNREPGEALKKLIIAGTVEVRPSSKSGRTRPGRIRLRHVMARTKLELLEFVTDVVQNGSVVVTDGLGAYKDLDLKGYERAVESTARGTNQDDVLRHFHLVVSNLKAWLRGTLHGEISGKHLQAYLNEYVFRVNRRGNPQAAFQTLLGIATNTAAPTYNQLYADEGEPDGWEHPATWGRTGPRTCRSDHKMLEQRQPTGYPWTRAQFRWRVAAATGLKVGKIAVLMVLLSIPVVNVVTGAILVSRLIWTGKSVITRDRTRAK